MAEQPPSSAPQDSSGGTESFDNLVIQAPQPVREDYIQNAVKFLSHPKVKGSPVFHRRSFLEKKGLTNEEIDEAFRRVPDPKPNGTETASAGSQQANNHNQSDALQPYAEQPQAATGSITAGTISPHMKAQFSWVNTLLGAGLFLGLGASAAITLKKWFIPSLKSWTRTVVAEEDENAKDELSCNLYEEIREAINISASTFSDIARTNQEVLASKDEDRKVLMKLTEAFESQANVFKSLNETLLNHIRENRFSQYNLLEEHVQPAPWNGAIDYQGRASPQTNMYPTPPNSSFDPGRHSFMPLPEPTYGSYSGSYTERVQRPGYGFQPQMSNDRQNLSLRSNYQGVSLNHHTGNAIDDPAVEFQRRWVPPQPPGVIMPEAAAAIRHPRSVPRQQSQPVDGHSSTDVLRPSERVVATTEQMNGTPGAPDGELAGDGGAATASASSSGGSEEQQQEAA
ncbi:peroxisomal membrane protein PEX14-like isoform X2 [Panicum virgatum]|uniref:Peroxisomal membrane protein PEX14 n=1 Tax=Panicum virgatum TaxID=38727 RepID=A0A8T0RMH0_PANVG|nr:peroxisomal membrane protein PEX14-like isoform X2 [Panicum virgatum]KAG2587492.1 hypothetical protein PVAP13_5NG144400 [Panicum virgatum]